MLVWAEIPPILMRDFNLRVQPARRSILVTTIHEMNLEFNASLRHLPMQLFEEMQSVRRWNVHNHVIAAFSHEKYYTKSDFVGFIDQCLIWTNALIIQRHDCVGHTQPLMAYKR